MSVILRNGVEIADPLFVVLPVAEARWAYDVTATPPASFGEPDLRLANRGGARISGAQIAAVLERQRAIERALRGIPSGASLTSRSVPWASLGQLFEGFAGIRGLGFSKMTKTLHRKRPALIPILDSVVHHHLADDDPGEAAAFGARALSLVRGYKRDLDRNRAALRAVRGELRARGHDLTEVRILDLLIWYVEAG